MNFNNINYFLVIAEEESISAASRRLFISQQSLSAHLSKLENEVGTPLFKRGAKLTLTPAGKRFFDGCKQLMEDYNSTILDIHNITAERYNKLTIGVPTYGCPPYFGRMLDSFQNEHPEFTLNIVKRQHFDVGQNMDGVDLYLSAVPLKPELQNRIILENDPYCVTFRKSLAESVYGDSWSSVEERLILTKDLSLLREMPFGILLDRYGQMSTDLSLIFTENNFHPKANFTSELLEFLEHVCVNGISCFLAPSSYVKMAMYENPDVDTEDLLSFPINVTSFETKLAISQKKGLRLHPAESAFVKAVKKYFAESQNCV